MQYYIRTTRKHALRIFIWCIFYSLILIFGRILLYARGENLFLYLLWGYLLLSCIVLFITIIRASTVYTNVSLQTDLLAHTQIVHISYSKKGIIHQVIDNHYPQHGIGYRTILFLFYYILLLPLIPLRPIIFVHIATIRGTHTQTDTDFSLILYNYRSFSCDRLHTSLHTIGVQTIKDKQCNTQ